MNKLKEILNKLKEKVRSIPKKNLIISIVVIIIIIGIITTILVVNNKRLTKLEEIKIKEVNNKISDYLEEYLSNQEDKGKYINFAIEYLTNTTNKKEFSTEEVIQVIEEFFNQNIDNEYFAEVGISPKMLEKGIIYDSAQNIYKYENNKTRADIASTAIVKYELTNIKKINKEKFIVSYEKYIIEKPYDIYNYYNEKNLNGESNEEILTKITKYLKGEETQKVIKDIINKDEIENYGKKDGTIEVEYIIKGENLVINS